jgi:hypothetical protein
VGSAEAAQGLHSEEKCFPAEIEEMNAFRSRDCRDEIETRPNSPSQDSPESVLREAAFYLELETTHRSADAVALVEP